MRRVMNRWRWLGWTAVGWTSVACLAGCNGPAPSDRQIQQQAAQTTAIVRQDAKQAAADTRAAAANAERGVDAVAAGVKQGMHENAPPVDINRASQLRLATLPGISLAKAGEIVDGRPYATPRQLVSRGLLTREQYARVEGEMTAGGRVEKPRATE